MGTRLVSPRKVGRMKTSALLTLLTYYERTRNNPGRKAVIKELREREQEEAS